MAKPILHGHHIMLAIIISYFLILITLGTTLVGLAGAMACVLVNGVPQCITVSTTMHYSSSTTLKSSTTLSSSSTTLESSSTSTITMPITIMISNGCVQLTQSNAIYLLTSNIGCNATTISLVKGVSGITLNCQGHEIENYAPIEVNNYSLDFLGQNNNNIVENCVINLPSIPLNHAVAQTILVANNSNHNVFSNINLAANTSITVINSSYIGITNSVFTYSLGAVLATNSSGDYIYNNTILNALTGISLINTSNTQVLGNKIYNAINSALLIGKSDNNTLKNNVMDWSYDDAIQTRYIEANGQVYVVNGTTIANNIAFGDADAFLEDIGSDNTLIANNIIGGIGNAAIWFNLFPGFNPPPPGTFFDNHTTIINNVFYSISGQNYVYNDSPPGGVNHVTLSDNLFTNYTLNSYPQYIAFFVEVVGTFIVDTSTGAHAIRATNISNMALTPYINGVQLPKLLKGQSVAYAGVNLTYFGFSPLSDAAYAYVTAASNTQQPPTSIVASASQTGIPINTIFNLVAYVQNPPPKAYNLNFCVCSGAGCNPSASQCEQYGLPEAGGAISGFYPLCVSPGFPGCYALGTYGLQAYVVLANGLTLSSSTNTFTIIPPPPQVSLNWSQTNVTVGNSVTANALVTNPPSMTYYTQLHYCNGICNPTSSSPTIGNAVYNSINPLLSFNTSETPSTCPSGAGNCLGPGNYTIIACTTYGTPTPTYNVCSSGFLWLLNVTGYPLVSISSISPNPAAYNAQITIATTITNPPANGDYIALFECSPAPCTPSTSNIGYEGQSLSGSVGKYDFTVCGHAYCWPAGNYNVTACVSGILSTPGPPWPYCSAVEGLTVEDQGG